VSTAAPAARALLARELGDGAVREGAEADAVGGIVPGAVVTPAGEEAVAAVCAVAHREGLALVVRGAGTKQRWGRPPRRCDAVLDTRRLGGVVEHAPGDLVCTVRAGTTLDELRGALDAAPGHRQWLPLDPPQGGSQTLGGAVATPAYGARRARYGTARDRVIGAP